MSIKYTWVKIRSTGRWLVTMHYGDEQYRSLGVMDDFGNIVIFNIIITEDN